MKPTGTTLVIWNSAAGSAADAALLRALLERRPDVVVRESLSYEHARDLAAGAERDGATQVVAAGGDGTVNAVVNGLAGNQHRAPLLVLPLGTANDLCRTLAVPLDVGEAAALLDDGEDRRIDLVRLDTATRSVRYANMAAGGYSGTVMRLVTDDVKQRWGSLSYVRTAFEALGTRQCYHVDLRIDHGAAERFEAFNLIIGNGRTSAGGIAVAPGSDPEDGRFDLIVVRDGSLLELAGVAAQLVADNLLDSDQIVHRRARTLELASRPAMLFSADGELVEEEPRRFTVEPRALLVRVGADYQRGTP